MLKRVDKTLAIGSWLTAALLVLMLFAGPAVVANDDNSQATSGAAPYGKAAPAADGAKVFQGNCGRCHTLTPAGTTGTIGPNLDNVSLSASDIESIVRSGSGVMPAFANQLSGADITAVAAFVAKSASH
jgi:mono/diheme cytochrome c family protein